MSAPDDTAPDLTTLTAEVISAYVAHNSVHRNDLAAVIASVHGALRALAHPAPAEPERPEPRVPIKRSITPDHLISLEDGKRYKTLKRHLTGLGLTPEQYRAKWGLPADYPMSAPNYSKQRSEMARSMQLGQKRRKTPALQVVADAAPEEAPKPARKGGRRKASAEAST